jgi:hypothetical protein
LFQEYCTDGLSKESINYQDVYPAFERYIKELRKDEKVGSAELYASASNSLKRYKKNLEFVDITPKFLKGYEK